MAESEQIITLPYEFNPWPHQDAIFRAFYDEGKRRLCEVIHRRGGKDMCLLNLMICEMMQRVGNYAHVFPQRNRARRSIWQGIDSEGKRYIDHFPPELVLRKVDQEMMIVMRHPEDEDAEGSIFWVMGSDKDEHVLVGANPVGIIWSEYAEINPRMRTLVLPILRRNKGWEGLVYTPRGRNHGYRVYQSVRNDPEWHTSYLTIHDTMDHDGKPLVTPEDVEADIRAGMTREEADQEYYLNWDVPMPGAVYKDEMYLIDQEGRIGHYPYNPAYPVSTCWDIGPAHTAIWWFQQIQDRVVFIDYEEGPGSLPYWVQFVRDKPYIYDHSRVSPPLTRQPYEVHYGPWDLEQDDYATGKSRYGIALDNHFRFSVIPKGAVEDRIETARRLLGASYFNEHSCEGGIDALRSYRYDIDENRSSGQVKSYGKVPRHDWASHGADAFGCGAVGILPPMAPPKAKPLPSSFEAMRKLAIDHRKGKNTRHRSFKVFG